MKKVALAVLAVFSVFFVTACGCQREKFVVSFDTAGGSNIESVEVLKNDKVEKPTDPTKEGYDFLGWYLNGEKFDFDTKIKENITLTAKWKKLSTTEEPVEEQPTTPTNPSKPVVPNDSSEEVLKFTVTLDVDGEVTVYEVEKEMKFAKPTDPTKEGYTFLGWYIDDDEYDFDKKVTENIILTAKWQKNEPVLEVKIEAFETSIAHEAMLYMYLDGVKVAGYADIETIAGNKVLAKEIPVTGLKIDDRETNESLITNLKVK